MLNLFLTAPTMGALCVMLLAPVAYAQSGEVVEGRVISRSDGAPIRKASVLLRGVDLTNNPRLASPDSFLTETDGEGRFAVSGVPPGTYECFASRAGFERKPDTRTGDILQIRVVRGQPVAGVVLRPMPSGTTSGRVLDSEGAPVINAHVDALLYYYFPTGKTLASRLQATTNDKGEFRLFGLYPGNYYVRVTPPDERFDTSTVTFRPFGVSYTYMQRPRSPVRGPVPPALQMAYYPDETDVARAVSIEIPPGGETGPVEIRLQRVNLHSIRGSAPKGPSSLSFDIQKRPADPSFQWGGTQTQADGTFEISMLPPGSYSITAQRIVRGDRAFTYSRAIVEIADADVEGVGLTFSPGVQISGTVKAEGQTPVALGGVTVSFHGTEGAKWNASIDTTPDGTFTLGNILPDVYHVTVGHAFMSPAEKASLLAYATSIKLGDQELADQMLDLRSPISESLKVTVSGDMGRIEGKVLDDKGQPSPKVYVTLIPDQSKWDWQYRYRDTFADAEGRYSFTSVVPGHYTLMSWQDVEHGAPMDADFRRPFDQLGTPVEVLPDGHLTFNLKAIDTDKHP